MGTVRSDSLPAPSNLRVEYMSSPIGLSESQPRFSFIVDCTNCHRGISQHAVQIVVTNALDTHSVVWDSGIMVSNRTSQLEYDGLPLTAETSYVWTVRWWATGQNMPSPNSTASFDIGLLSEKDWAGAEWIGNSNQTQLRREFKVPTGSPIVWARAYIAAPGCHTLYINGKEYASMILGSDQMGVCPWTQFGKSVLYQTHDLTNLVRSGSNVIGLLLGNGMWSGGKKKYANDPGVRIKLFVEQKDGSRTVVISTSSRTNLCASINEYADAVLRCPKGHIIDTIDFASFGLPTGSCVGDPSKSDTNTFAVNPSCNADNVGSMIAAHCIGYASCRLSPQCKQKSCTLFFDGSTVKDPCVGFQKYLSVAIKCVADRRSIFSHESLRHQEHFAADPWLATKGPFLKNDPFDGTHTDWRLLDGPNNVWSTPEFNINQSVVAWRTVMPMPVIRLGQLRSLTMPLTRVIRTIHPIKVTKLLGDAGYRYDFPENFVGVVKVTVPDTAPTGSSISLKHGEILTTTGAVSFPWNENGQTDDHILDGKTKVLLPRFTWHGFQYVQIKASGFTWGGKLDTIEGLVLHNNLDQTGKIKFAGGLAGEGTLLNSIQGLVTASQLSNVAAFQPTDCPTREKGGWLGDAQVTAEEAMYNFQMAPIYTEFLNTIRDAQNIGNGNVPPEVPHGGLSVRKLEIPLDKKKSKKSSENTQENYVWNSEENFSSQSIYEVLPQSGFEEMTTYTESQEKRILEEQETTFQIKITVEEYNIEDKDKKETPKGNDTNTESPLMTPLTTQTPCPRCGPNVNGRSDISWTAAYPLITRWMLKYYGDTRVVTRHFDSLIGYMDGELNSTGSRTKGLPDDWQWGDWCAIEPRTLEIPGTGPELASFNFILALDAMAEMAARINRSTAHTKYANLAQKFRSIFHSLYFNSSTGTYGRAPLEVQSLTVAPLALGNTIPKEKVATALGGLLEDIEKRANHLTVGAVGAKHLLPQLTAHGLHATAMRIATQTSYPSLGHWIKMGATTCWENYSGKADETHPAPPSRNHIFLCGGFGEWVYRSVAGVAPTMDGYDRIIFAPEISNTVGPSSAEATLQTVRGTVMIGWELQDNVLSLNVSIPLSVQANVEVPLLDATKELFKIFESSKPVWVNGAFVSGIAGIVAGVQKEQTISLEVLSGSYAFKTQHQ